MAQDPTSGDFPAGFEDANAFLVNTGWNEDPIGFDFDGAFPITAQSQTPSDYSSIPFSAAPHEYYNTAETGISDILSYSDGYPCSHSPTDELNITGDVDGLGGLPESDFLGLGTGVEQTSVNNNTQPTHQRQGLAYQQTGNFLEPSQPSISTSSPSSSLVTQENAPQHNYGVLHGPHASSLALSTASQPHARRGPTPTIVVGHNDGVDSSFRRGASNTYHRPTPMLGSSQHPVNTLLLELAWKLKTIIQRFHLSGPEACVRLSEMFLPQSMTRTLIDDEVAELALQGLCTKLQGFQRRFGIPQEDIINNLRNRISQLLPSNRPPTAPSDSSLELPYCCLHSANPSLTAMRYRSGLVKKPCAQKGASGGSFTCKKCKGTFENETAWRRHVEQTDPDVLWCCSRCNKGKLYHRKDQALAHLRKVHGMSKNEAHDNHEKLIVDDGKAITRQCKQCGQIESDWNIFYRHVQKHMKDRASNTEETSQTMPLDDNDPAAGGSFDGGSTGSSGFGGPYTGPTGYDSGDSNSGSYNPFSSYQFNQNCNHSPAHFLQSSQASDVHGKSHDKGPSSSDKHKDCYGRRNTLSCSHLLIDSALKEFSLCQKLSSLPKINTDVPRYILRPRLNKRQKLQYQHHQYCSKYHGIGTLWKTRNSCIEQVQDECTKTKHIRKTVTLTVGSPTSDKHFGREVRILKRLRHPHITELVSSFVGESVYSFIMNPVADCSLERYLECPPPDSRSKLLKWFGCLASAVDYLHSNEVSVRHSDIKPANVLVREDDIFIADFGISRRLASPMDPNWHSQPVTRMYAAPEIFKGIRDWRADIFGLGCVYLEMITVLCNISIQYYHRTLMQAIAEHRKTAVHLTRLTTTQQWIVRLRNAYYNEQCRIQLNSALDTVDAMLSNNLEARPTAEQVLQRFPHTQCNSHFSRKRPRTPSFPKLLEPVPIATPVTYIRRETDAIQPDKEEAIGRAPNSKPSSEVSSAGPPRIVIEHYDASKPTQQRTSIQIPSRPRASSTPLTSDTTSKSRIKAKRSVTMTSTPRALKVSPDPKAVHVIEGVLDPSRTPQNQFGQLYVEMPGVQDPTTTLSMLHSCLLQTLHTHHVVKRRPSERLLKAAGNSEGRAGQVSVVNLFGRIRSQLL